jgi:N,N'-diacetylbacillosaminyl-diphospho-undecaprenol alpha-1,3-N-acetylgalactosaminyltransferase
MLRKEFDNTPRIALVSNTDYYLYHFRLGLIKELVNRGLKVYTIAPPGEFTLRLEDAGAIFVPWILERSSFNPLQELQTFASLIQIYRSIKPTIVHHFTVKPNIYGSIAAGMMKDVGTLSSITGLGYIFTGDGAKARAARPLISNLYRLALHFSDAITFQNYDDLETFRRFKVLPPNKTSYVHGGSGVNTAFFNPEMIDKAAIHRLRESLGLNPNSIVVLFVGRMLWHKGIGEYVECARVLKKTYGSHFLLVGPVDEGNLASIPITRLIEWEKEGCIQYLNKRDDIRELLALSDIVVLPSYREGMPRFLLEAAAMRKPIVTTNVPGCKDVVDHEINGLLVEPKDPIALTRAVESLLLSPDRRERFGEAARQKALKEFDETRINAQILSVYNNILERQGKSKIIK